MTALLTPDALEDGFHTVIVTAPDVQGRLFGKRMSPRVFRGVVDEGMDVCTCALSWDIGQGLGVQVGYAGFHTGWHDFRLMPDLHTLRAAPWLPGTAVCIADAVDTEGFPDLVAPRNVLRRQVDALAGDELTAYFGTELEFYLFRGSYDDARERHWHGLRPTTETRADYSIFQGDQWESFFAGLRAALDGAGIDTYLSQAEYGFGQWEVNLEYQPALEMADRHVLFKLAVRNVAQRAGLAATFMPRPTTADLGSSCHVHFSLRDADDGSVFYAGDDLHSMSDRMRHAIGGILEHAPDLMAWYGPTINSYRRLNTQDVAGNGATWGFDNRTVSARVLGHSPASMRVEFRVPGADVNPYLVLAALIASARDGIARKCDPGPPVIGDAYQKDVRPYPTSLDSATEAFAGSAFAHEAFGDAVVEHYAALNRYEVGQFGAAVTDWERERYFELI